MVDSIDLVVSQAQLQRLADLHEPDEVRRQLRCLGPRDEQQAAVAADLYFYCYVFGREQGFSPLKLATFLSICKEVFDFDMSTNDPAMTMELSFDRLERLLLLHAVDRPPKSVGVFDRDDVAAIVDTLLHLYFRHWRLYKTCFTARLEGHFVQVAPFGVEPPPLPHPLATATPLEIDGHS